MGWLTDSAARAFENGPAAIPAISAIPVVGGGIGMGDAPSRIAGIAGIAGLAFSETCPASSESQPHYSHPTGAGIAGIAGIAGRRFCETRPEAAPGAPIPPAFSAALAALQSACPAGVPADRHRQAVADGAALLDRWGAEAERLGWSVAAVFGLHHCDGVSDRESMGLVWWLEGGTVTALEAGFATIMQPNGLPAYLAFPL